jgi:hypothetical protein
MERVKKLGTLRQTKQGVAQPVQALESRPGAVAKISARRCIVHGFDGRQQVRACSERLQMVELRPVSSQKILQNFLYSSSHRIFRHIYKTLNIDKK